MTTKSKTPDAAEETPDVPEDVAAYRMDRREDYSKWVAAQNIYHDGVLAYTEGSPVPDTNVRLHKYDKTDPPLVKPAKG